MTGRRLLLGYQLLTGISDSATGLLLIAAPAFTLRLMQIHVAAAALPFLSYIGVFVLAVGIACFYGAAAPAAIKAVWWLTGITRTLVSAFLTWHILSGDFEPAWITVAASDGLLALFQFVGLSRGWLKDTHG